MLFTDLIATKTLLSKVLSTLQEEKCFNEIKIAHQKGSEVSEPFLFLYILQHEKLIFVYQSAKIELQYCKIQSIYKVRSPTFGLFVVWYQQGRISRRRSSTTRKMAFRKPKRKNAV